MFIRHELPSSNWTKIDRKVFTLPISAGAKVLYGYLCSMKNGSALKKDAMAEELGIKPRTLTTQERELKDANLLIIEQIQPRIYVAYIGHTKKTAEQVKIDWKKEDII